MRFCLAIVLVMVPARAQELMIHQAVEIDFQGEAGQYYQLESSTDFVSWTSIGEPFRGTGKAQVRSVRVSPQAQFFRTIETTPKPSTNEEIVFQHSTLGALLVGVYEGDMSFGELLDHGDFGLGTFQGVDGELVILDGEAFRVRVDGSVSHVTPEAKTPFGVVTFFEPDIVFELSNLADYAALQSAIDERLVSSNLPYAIKITGTFDTLQTRSVPAQTRPYPTLADVVASQTVFDFQDIKGTMAGFRLPTYVSELNASGYHFHFVDDQQAAGGHVLQMSASSVRVEIDICRRLEIDLPGSDDFLTFEP